MTRVIKSYEFEGEAATATAVLNLADIADEARSIVLEARKEAARITYEAREKAERIQQAALEDGRAEGLALGRQEGFDEGSRRAAEQAGAAREADESQILEAASSILGEIRTLRRELTDQMQHEALRFAVELAGKIVARVAARDLSAAEANLAKVLERAPTVSTAKVKVNPMQLDALRSRFAQLVETCSAASVELVGDEQIPLGGAKLVTPNGQVDATIRTQLDTVAEVLLGSGAEGGAA